MKSMLQQLCGVSLTIYLAVGQERFDAELEMLDEDYGEKFLSEIEDEGSAEQMETSFDEPPYSEVEPTSKPP